MDDETRRRLVVLPVEGCPPEVRRGLWALQDTRRRARGEVAGIDDATLDWTPPTGGNCIGTLLYHIAAIELDWLFVEVLQQPEPWPDEVTRLFPFDVRDEAGALTRVGGQPLAAHLMRLEAVRQQ